VEVQLKSSTSITSDWLWTQQASRQKTWWDGCFSQEPELPLSLKGTKKDGH